MKKLDINKVSTTTFILFLICALVTAALAGTNYITKDKIDLLAKENEKNARNSVLSAEDYIAETVDINGEKFDYYVAKDKGNVVGYIATASAKGYGGKVEVMVGMDLTDTITSIKVLSAADETPGLGMNVTKKSFYEQFSGKKADYSEFTAVTGATISSNAVDTAVKNALTVLKAAKERQVK